MATQQGKTLERTETKVSKALPGHLFEAMNAGGK
jgi:hypothetical protein